MIDTNKTCETNLSKKEWFVLKNVTENPDIIIKCEDKGRTVTFMTTNHCKSMMYEYLNGEKIIRKYHVDKGDIKDLSKLVSKYIKRFTENERKYFKTAKTEASNFYGLPKIHKSILLKNAIEKQNSEIIAYPEHLDLKIRPVVREPKFPTRKLCNFFDILLKLFLKHIRSYIKDSLDFLIKCQIETEHETVIATFNVVRLYTSILHDLGLEAIGYFLSNFRNDLYPRLPKPFFIEAVDFALKKAH